MKKHIRFTGIVRTIATASVVVYGSAAYAAIPPGYYNSANSSNAAALHASLHEIIDDHQRFPYTSSSTDTWDILELADQDPDNSNNVIDVYKNASYPKVGGGNTNYNREHSWPKSYGFPNDGSTNYAYTDTHHLFIANSSYNSSRSNKPYANCDSSCAEKVTEFNNNRGGTSTQSNWTTGSFENGTWETWSGRRGDVARALMYMAVRYEGGTHGVTGVDEPDLRLTDDRTLIGNSSTGSNISVAYMGLKSVLLQWHAEDPVDDMERLHNDTVYSFQGNRNPFVDHPEFVECVFQNICSGGGGDTTPPGTPANFSATGGSGLVELAWTANQESDLAGYNVYRSDSLNGTYTQLNSGLINTSAYTDESVTASTTYFYKVSAVDTSSNESALSAAQSATTDAGSGGGSAQAWINELHYDNDGSDSNEFIEVAATAGTDLSGWSLVAYNGNGGSSYKTVALSGIVSDQSSGFGFVQFAFSGLQNGAPDGIALMNGTGDVVQFLSYEGVMTATDGAASGIQSTDIGVSESSSTPVGYSLQLAGTGNSYDSFTWQAAQANTGGLLNAGQTMQGSGGNQDPVAQFSYGCNGLSCSFDASASSDPDGTIVSYDWNLGDGTLLSGAMPNHSYGADGSYTVTLTVTDDAGATHQQSQQVVVNDPPAVPAGASAQGGLQQITVSWNANSESDLAGYNLYRSDTSGGTLTKLNGALLVDTFYTDSGLTDNTSYYYRVSAVDSSGNESALAAEVTATTDNPGSGGSDVWINELHYDNKGSDSNEFVELAGNAGTNLSGWSLVGYNGNGGSVYKTVNLSGTIANQQNGFGTISFSFSGFQNGGPDGIALVNDAGVVVQFLSYEGTMTASDGPAQGMLSEDIGVAETSSTKKGHSLQLGGTGTAYADFYWQSAANDTPGSINNNQIF